MDRSRTPRYLVEQYRAGNGVGSSNSHYDRGGDAGLTAPLPLSSGCEQRGLRTISCGNKSAVAAACLFSGKLPWMPPSYLVAWASPPAGSRGVPPRFQFVTGIETMPEPAGGDARATSGCEQRSLRTISCGNKSAVAAACLFSGKLHWMPPTS